MTYHFFAMRGYRPIPASSWTAFWDRKSSVPTYRTMTTSVTITMRLMFTISGLFGHTTRFISARTSLKYPVRYRVVRIKKLGLAALAAFAISSIRPSAPGFVHAGPLYVTCDAPTGGAGLDSGRPGGARTPNIRFWRPALYQLELLACPATARGECGRPMGLARLLVDRVAAAPLA